jgi:hypothetical protein
MRYMRLRIYALLCRRWTNACDQQLAAKGLSTPQDTAASLLHRVVRQLSLIESMERPHGGYARKSNDLLAKPPLVQ